MLSLYDVNSAFFNTLAILITKSQSFLIINDILVHGNSTSLKGK